MSNTELIDRYLNAVKRWLPDKQQKDLLAELAEDLQSQVEERESAMGRRLSEDELIALLKQRGSPMRVASGFIPEERLINPAMLPIYRMVLKIVLLWVMAPLFALIFIGPIFTSGHAGAVLLRFWDAAWRTCFSVIGIVTVVFWLLDRYHSHWVDRWDPRKLPRVPRSQQQMEWYNDFAGFAFGMGGFVFWGVLMWRRTEFVFSNGSRIGLAPIWSEIYWIVVGFTLLRALIDFYCWVRPTWSAPRSWVRLALDAAAIIVPLLLLRVANWVDVAAPHATPAELAKLVAWLNHSMQVILISIPLITSIDVIRQGRRLWRAKSDRATPVLAV